MELSVMAIYDAKSDCYLAPFFVRNVNQGVRYLADCVAKDDHDYAKFPEDFVLFQIGTFDDGSGVIVGMEPRAVVRAAVLRSEALKARRENV